ncbi:MAG: GDP-6-deoxy-D-mannose reductase [Chlamydiae bacterium]|nr:GDP-6-deoxy-D-mannose reductase [Chlamydiota bacterium]
MQALVTGASGFTGRHLVEFLLSQGCTVHTLGRQKVPGAEHHPLSLDLPSIQSIITKIRPDYLFHLAGCVTSTSLSEIFNVNVIFAAHLLEALDLAGLSDHTRILIVGSAAEYGTVSEQSLPISEDFAPNPYSLYGISKFTQTQMALNWAQSHRKLLVVRPFTIVGPGMPEHMAIGNFVRQIKAIMKQGRKGKIETGNIDVQRDFLSIQDTVEIYWKLIQTEGAFGRVINACSGRPIALKTMLSYLLEKSGGEIDVCQSERMVRSIDMKTHYGDNRLLLDLVGDMELTSWEKPLDLMLER